jgi:tetratricopeptide (TPR) repeat protein
MFMLLRILSQTTGNAVRSTLRRLPRCMAGLLLAGLCLGPAWGDTIVLQDNRQIIGVIDPASSNDVRVTIRTAAGTVQIPRENILRIEREKNVSYTESSGDLAVAEGKLERALDLYAKALEGDDQNARIKEKIENTKKEIEKRDQEFYGSAFENIRGLIAKGQFEKAIEASDDLARKVRVDSARQRCQTLIAEARIGLARKYRDTVNYSAAEMNYNMAAQVAPNNPVPLIEMAEMLESSPARKAEAIPLYVKGIEHAQAPVTPAAKAEAGQLDESKLLRARFQLGKLYRDEKQYDKAADTLLEVMRLDKNYQFPQAVDLAVDSYSKIQSNELNNENIERIITNLRSIIALKPTEQRAFLLLGRIYFDRGDWAKARENLQAAVRNATNAPQPRNEALYYLGISDRKLGDLNSAAEAFQTLLDNNASTYDSTCELAEIRLEQADYNRALELFKRAHEMDKDKYRAYLGMGEAQQKLGRFNEARENYQTVVTKDPTNARAQLRIAESYFEEEKWDDAGTEAEKAIKIAQEADKPTTATKVMDTESSKPLLIAKGYTLMGNANLNLQKANLARENFNTALKSMAEYAPALDGIGRTYQTDGLHKDAEAFFNKAITADPKNPAYYLSMGINWHKYRKSTEKALPYYMKYIELGGKDPNVRAWIKECGGTPPA